MTPTMGMTSRTALMTVHVRPPKRVTANVYGRRMRAPTRLGRATSQNFWLKVYGKRAGGRATTMTLHSVHTEKPRCSAKTEKIRFRRATRRPVVAQKDGFSGSQSVRQRVFVAG